MPIVANLEIRESAKRNGVKLWRVAEGLGMSDVAFSKKLRRELPAHEREKILGIINDLASENTRVS